MKNGYQISTTFWLNGTIAQETIEIGYDFRRTTDYRIMNTRDEQIRKALIALGWTPPPEIVGQEQEANRIKSQEINSGNRFNFTGD